MGKSKLGLPVGLTGALLALLAILCGGTSLVVLGAIGFILYKEENKSLRSTAINILCVVLAFAAVDFFLNLISSSITTFAKSWGHQEAFNIFYLILDYLEAIVLVFMAVLSFSNKQLNMSVNVQPQQPYNPNMQPQQQPYNPNMQPQQQPYNPNMQPQQQPYNPNMQPQQQPYNPNMQQNNQNNMQMK